MRNNVTIPSLFKNRDLVIAGIHGKETVMAPLFEKELGVKCTTNHKFNTDALGTFTGDVERELSPFDTLRKKCLKVMEWAGCTLGVASEGTFGPHPQIGLIPSDTEMVMLIDTENNLEITARWISTNTNLGAIETSEFEELKKFALQAGFPSHAIILRPAEKVFVDMKKGIRDWQVLLSEFLRIENKYGKVYAETDMRAMMNPTRMEVIETATSELIKKIKSVCPHCSMPGFTVKDRKAGLPCKCCGFPTRSALIYIHNCQSCGHTLEQLYPQEKTNEDPMYCDHCNP